jgi:hypothetical protein
VQSHVYTHSYSYLQELIRLLLLRDEEEVIPVVLEPNEH